MQNGAGAHQEHWFAREQISQSISRIWEPMVHGFFQSNIWMIEGTEKNLVVDFGMGLSSLRDYLETVSRRPFIAVATHSHVDHVGSFHEFGDRHGSFAEAELFETMPDKWTLAHLFRKLADPVISLPSAGWDKSAFKLKSAPLSSSLREGDTVDLGNYFFKIVALPGHSPGSIGLYDCKCRILISGDAIYSGGLVDDVEGSDRKAYVQTMERLLKMDIDLVLPGHNRHFDGTELRRIAAAYIERNSTDSR